MAAPRRLPKPRSVVCGGGIGGHPECNYCQMRQGGRQYYPQGVARAGEEEGLVWWWHPVGGIGLVGVACWEVFGSAAGLMIIVDADGGRRGG